jgi:hypothetical protein
MTGSFYILIFMNGLFKRTQKLRLPFGSNAARPVDANF